MDILQARKRAREEQEKQDFGKASPVSPPVEQVEQKEEPPAPVEQTQAVQEKSRKVKATPSGKSKPKKEAASKKANYEKPEEAASKSQAEEPPEPPQAEIKHTKIEEIPQGARAPEEIELAPYEFQGLPGTQEMPELPEITEEEKEASVELGEAPPPAHEKAHEETPKEIPLTPSAKEETPPQKAAPHTLKMRPSKAHIEEKPMEKAKIEEAFQDEGEGGAEKLFSEVIPLEFLSFMLGKEEYGIPLQRISEIIKPRAITEVPRVPQFVMGILTLRGVVIPVFDLAKKLSLGRVTIGKFSRIIIVYQKDDKVGLLVDRVRDVVRVLPRDIEPPPAVIAGVDMQFLEGVGRAEGGEGIHQVVEKTPESDQDTEVIKARKRLIILLNLERVANL